jgi:hypothetical protein
MLAGGCAGPAADPASDVTDPGSPCAACTVTFDVCRKADDYNPCLAMRRSCVNWCVSAATCAEACDGAQWGCESVIDLRRSTCEKTANACAEYCGSARVEPP